MALNDEAHEIKYRTFMKWDIDQNRLDDAMAQLTALERIIFFLHDIVGQQHHEIADRLGLSEERSRLKLHQARMALRKMLITA